MFPSSCLDFSFMLPSRVAFFHFKVPGLTPRHHFFVPKVLLRAFCVFLAFLALDRMKNSKSVSYNKFLHSDFIPCVQSQPAIRRCPPKQASSGLVRPDVCGVLSGNFAGPPHAQAEVSPPRAEPAGVPPPTGAPGQWVI